MSAAISMAQDSPFRMMTRDDRLSHMARTIHERMLKLGLTQADVCRRSGIGRDSMSRYAAGETIPGPLLLDRLARALEIEPRDLDPGVPPERLLFRPTSANDAALEFKQDPADPDRYWVRINQSLPADIAVEIMLLMQKVRTQQ